MDVEQLKQDVAEGNVSLDRLVDLIASQQKLIEKLQKQVAGLQEKIDGKIKGRTDELALVRRLAASKE